MAMSATHPDMRMCPLDDRMNPERRQYLGPIPAGFAAWPNDIAKTPLVDARLRSVGEPCTALYNVWCAHIVWQG
jgi:hypothetical protein